MSEHVATISWTLSGEDFCAGKYSREHTWAFDGGVVVPASPSPSLVPKPHTNPANDDPEEAYVAANSSCHKLSFLYEASRKGFEVRSYADRAVGIMTKNEQRAVWVSAVKLHPRIEYGSRSPTPDEETSLHDAAHHGCFIANSVKTDISVATPATE
jgi:organic hydroperoxide reductase OsmC/OhrA